MCLDVLRCIWMCLEVSGMSGCVWVCPAVLEYVGCVGDKYNIQIYLGI